MGRKRLPPRAANEDGTMKSSKKLCVGGAASDIPDIPSATDLPEAFVGKQTNNDKEDAILHNEPPPIEEIQLDYTIVQTILHRTRNKEFQKS